MRMGLGSPFSAGFLVLPYRLQEVREDLHVGGVH